MPPFYYRYALKNIAGMERVKITVKSAVNRDALCHFCPDFNISAKQAS